MSDIEGWTLGSLPNSRSFTADLSEALKSIFQSTLREEKNHYTGFMTGQGFSGHPDFWFPLRTGVPVRQKHSLDSVDMERQILCTRTCQRGVWGHSSGPGWVWEPEWIPWLHNARAPLWRLTRRPVPAYRHTWDLGEKKMYCHNLIL